ncbi:hypothetical protein ACWKWU_04160 [Chitinophaga lutea]
MKKTSLYLLFCYFFLSCQKEDKTVIRPAEQALQLNVSQVINDSTIVLTWNKPSPTHFRGYKLMRIATVVKDGLVRSVSSVIDSSLDVHYTSFTERNMPFARDISYILFAFTDTAPSRPLSSSVSYRRPRILLTGNPKDVLIDRDKKWLYIQEQQKITVLDYDGRIVGDKEFPVSIGYCSLGKHEGKTELYVPVNDGWLHILDAATFEMKEKIYVGGFEMGSVAAAHGKLVVGSSLETGSIRRNCTKVYDRASKQLVGQAGFWTRSRVTVLESNELEVIDISISLIPVSYGYYRFNASGGLVQEVEDPYHGDFQIDASIIRSFPDGSKFISSAWGTVYDKTTLKFDRYLRQSGSFSDFAFNADGSRIYAANPAQRKIEVVTYPATTSIAAYPTTFYPYKIFRDGNMLVCVEKSVPGASGAYILVEKINL